MGDVTCGQATSALRFPQGSGYKIRVREYPKLPPRLRWISLTILLFFVTFCTHERRKLLASDAAHAAFVAFATQRTFGAQRCCRSICDHARSRSSFRPRTRRFSTWAMGRNAETSSRETDCVSGTSPIWQRGFFDHVLRTDESYAQKWNYVRENPVRAGLVTKADDWPYSGEIVLIDRA